MRDLEMRSLPSSQVLTQTGGEGCIVVVGISAPAQRDVDPAWTGDDAAQILFI